MPYLQKESNDTRVLALNVIGTDGVMLGLRVHETTGVSLYRDDRDGNGWRKLWNMSPSA